MARIRSIHPGFFTASRYVSVSAYARLCFIGLWQEADDHGVFQWNALELKMRIFPGDAVDIAVLLDELEKADAVRSCDVDGKRFGFIRNFCTFQRPKKPTYVHPVPNQFRTFLGLSEVSSEPVENQFRTGGEPVGNQFGTGTEKSPQIGEERREEKGRKNSRNIDYVFAGEVVRLTDKDFDRWRQAYPALDLRAELTSRDAWLAGQTPDVRKKWFQSTATWLANQNARRRDETAAKQPAAAAPAKPRLLGEERLAAVFDAMRRRVQRRDPSADYDLADVQEAVRRGIITPDEARDVFYVTAEFLPAIPPRVAVAGGKGALL